MSRNSHPFLSLGLLGLLAASTPRILAAQETDFDCVTGGRPAATLLFPYFEVDLGDPRGRTTLVSFGNATGDPVLANVVMWTTCGFPVLDFTVYLPGGAVQPLDLRDLIVSGRFPVTAPTGVANPFPSCELPLFRPRLDQAELAALAARLLGQPDPADGMCYAAVPDPPQLAVGYLTVDVLNDCSETIRTPLDDGYFASGGTGLASNANALWGDFFFVDGNAAAQGFDAVSIVADSTRETGFGAGGTFYGNGDDRLPLGHRFRTRFFRGGGFDGGTQLIVWTDMSHFAPHPCGGGCSAAVNPFVVATARDQRGITFLGSERVDARAHTFRLEVGGEELPIGARFGVLDLQLFVNCSICSPPTALTQGWVLPVYTAGGFSVGLNATRLDDPFCK